VIDLIRAEILKLSTTRTFLALAIATAVLALVPTILVLAVAPEDALRGREALDLINGGASVIFLVVLVFGILGMTGEYRHGTITYTFLVVPRRANVMLIKLLVYTLVGAGAAALTLVATQAIGVVGLSLRGLPQLWPNGDQLTSYARLVVTTGLVGAFGVALGALIRNQILTVAGALIWVFLEVTIIVPVLILLKPGVAPWLPFTVFSQVVNAPVTGQAADIGLNAWQAFAVSIAYIAAASVAATLTTLRRDVT
jgi:ABC-2 type transport system permease protein